MSAWQQLIIPKSHTVGQALAVYEAQGKGIVCVCEADGTLIGIITDGDFRRVLAANNTIRAQPCTTIMNDKPVVGKHGIHLIKPCTLWIKRAAFVYCNYL